MSGMEELNIHVTYSSNTCIIIAQKSKFLQKVSKKFNLNVSDIELYDKKTSKKIGVQDLKDFLRVEVVKKGKVSDPQINSEDKRPPPVSVQTIYNKLKESKLLTTTETTHLCNHLLTLPVYLKRRLESGVLHPIEMKNRKIQANTADQKTVQTQTDLKVHTPSTSQARTTMELTMEMKTYAKKYKQDSSKTCALMTETFMDRRNFILLKRPMVQLVKQEYPLLFNLSEVRNELERIFTVGKCNDFLSNVEKYAEIILSMPSEEDPLFKTIREKENGYTTQIQKKYAVEVGSILMLSHLTGESPTFLQMSDTSFEQGTHPYIECDAKLNDIFFDQYTFKIITENIVVCEAHDFKEAILCLVAIFFIFNIQYPATSFNSMYLMEKIYLEALETEETEVEDDIKQIFKHVQIKAKNKRVKS